MSLKNRNFLDNSTNNCPCFSKVAISLNHKTENKMNIEGFPNGNNQTSKFVKIRIQHFLANIPILWTILKYLPQTIDQSFCFFQKFLGDINVDSKSSPIEYLDIGRRSPIRHL